MERQVENKRRGMLEEKSGPKLLFLRPRGFAVFRLEGSASRNARVCLVSSACKIPRILLTGGWF